MHALAGAVVALEGPVAHTEAVGAGVALEVARGREERRLRGQEQLLKDRAAVVKLVLGHELRRAR